MKAFVFFLFYFLMASLIAAIISYPLFSFFDNGGYHFERWVTRAALLSLFLGLFACFKLFNLSFYSIGHNSQLSCYFKKSFVGFLYGFTLLSLILSILFFLDIRLFSKDDDLSTLFFIKVLLAGITVALIEETLFRGLFFKITMRWHNPAIAIFISSFFYSILHFIKPLSSIDPNTLSLFSGFEVMANAFYALSELRPDDFMALFSVGILLAVVRYRTNSLAYCIGMHASWVFLLKTTKEFSSSNPSSSFSILVGEYDGIIGWLSFFSLILTSIIYYLYTSRVRCPLKCAT